MSNMKVYDDRTEKTLFAGTENECIAFSNRYLAGNPEDMDYIWVTINEKFFATIQEKYAANQKQSN